MLDRQRPPIHFVTEQRLRVQSALHVQSDVVSAVGRCQPHIAGEILLTRQTPIVPASRVMTLLAAAKSLRREPAQLTTTLQPSMHMSSVVISTRGSRLTSSSVS